MKNLNRNCRNLWNYYKPKVYTKNLFLHFLSKIKIVPITKLFFFILASVLSQVSNWPAKKAKKEKIKQHISKIKTVNNFSIKETRKFVNRLVQKKKKKRLFIAHLCPFSFFTPFLFLSFWNQTWPFYLNFSISYHQSRRSQIFCFYLCLSKDYCSVHLLSTTFVSQNCC